MIIEYEGARHEFPDSFSQEDISNALSSYKSPAQPSVGMDVAKSAGIGLAKGGIGLAGLPGDIRELAAKGASMGANLLGAPISQETVSGALKHIPMLGTPTSQQFQQGIEGVTGKFYEPQTILGKVAQTTGEFLPAVVGGPESLGVKLATRVAAPAAAVTAAEAAGGGPIAQTVAALGSGALAHRLTTPTPASTNPTAQELMKMGPVAAAKTPAVASVVLNPVEVEKVADSFTRQLRASKFNDRQSGGTFGLIEDLKNPINGIAPTMEDLQSTRERLGEIARNFNAGQDQAAATSAIKMLDQYAANVPKSHVLQGDMTRAAQIMAEARANFAHGATAVKVEEKIRNAELQAGSSYSGGNINNATRQKLRPLLTSETGRMGLKPEDLQAIEDTVTGGTAGNVLRTAGKFLGGGGGLGAMHSMLGFGGGGMALGAGPIGLAAPVLGYGLKKAGDIITKNKANSVMQNILARSPEAQARAAIAARNPLPLSLSAKQVGLLSAIVAAHQKGLLGDLGAYGSGNNDLP